MTGELCPCATECEWLPEHYALEHHPNCRVEGRRVTRELVEAFGKIVDELDNIFPVELGGFAVTVDYHCNACGHTWQTVHESSSPHYAPDLICPKCGVASWQAGGFAVKP